MGFGLGVFNNNTSSRVFNLGFRKDLREGFYWQAKGGLWIDNSGDPTHSNSGYFSTGPGFLVDMHPIEIRTGLNLGLITNPDSVLGGVFP